MKTKFNIHRTLSAIIIFVLITSSAAYSQTILSSVNGYNRNKIVSAQAYKNTNGFHAERWRKNWMKNKIDLNLEQSFRQFKIKMTLHEDVVEHERMLESWMFDQKYWEITYSSDKKIVDEQKQLEDWMFDQSFWQIVDEPDKKDLEDWMMDPNFWVLVN
jgi:hypothetical protein